MVHYTALLILICSILILTQIKIKISPRRLFNQEFRSFYFAYQTMPNFQTISFTPYKFYHELMESMVKWAKTTGINLKPILKELRGALSQDQKFEKKVSAFFYHAILQVSAIFILSWSYYFLLVYYTQKRLSGEELLVVLLWQLVGFSIYLYGLTIYKNRFIGIYFQVLTKLYQFNSFYSAGVTLTVALTESKVIHSLECHAGSEIRHLKVKLESLLNEVRARGVNIRAELAEMVEEIWFLIELRYEKFAQLMQVLKVAILLLFFVSSYFYLIYKMLTKNLMEF